MNSFQDLDKAIRTRDSKAVAEFAAMTSADMRNLLFGPTTLAHLARLEAAEAKRKAARARQDKIRNTRVNAAEAASLRASACSRCFSTHAGEC